MIPDKIVNKFRKIALLTGIACFLSALAMVISVRNHFYPGAIVAGCIFILAPVVAFVKIIRDEDWRNR